jgi:chemotaxis protein CheD
VAGGASVLGGADAFKIGERNVQATLSWLAREGFSVRHTDIGGNTNRTLHLEINTGNVNLKMPDLNQTYSLAA